VAVARALVNEPSILLADEPTGNLDSAASADVLRLFQTLHRGGLTLVFVTHDRTIASIADRVVSMRDGVLGGATGTRGGSRDDVSSVAG
jgi:ABC-type lipoprotein export system ATPase subunit